MSDGFIEMQLAGLQRDVEHERVRVREDHLAEDIQRQVEKRREAARPRPEPFAAEERVARMASRPRRRRWRDLEKFDEAHDALLQRQAEALSRLAEARAALERAPEDDARAVAAWMAGGECGDRPAPTLYDRERDVAAAQMLVDGVAIEIEQLLGRRRDHVERNRHKMVKDAREEIAAARAKLEATIQRIPALREELLAARELLLWAATFPEPIDPFGTAPNVGLGLAAVTRETLGTNAQLPFDRVMALLERDAQTLAETVSPQVKQALGTAGPRVPTLEAMWDGDPDMVAWKETEKERARMLHEHDFRDPHQLAQEIRG